MKANTRISVAYVAGCLLNRRSFPSLTDHSENKVIKIAGRIDFSSIDLQVQDDGSKIMGMIKGKEMTLFHSVDNSTVRMQLEGMNFKGHDNGADKDFTGSVTGKAVKIYDYETYQNFYFALND